ncbi:MAG: thioredoxin family protein [Candidatus Moranbacteria bacterium]|jgi:small redox-active disulfide protein 2|nr:thioredoxin family protein [Candidatus Moranbacteria bacterium]MDD5652271.1 thioredoxin family protein [Candidatus Moranbacteria bacterium]MDX9855713.1 thioredoxin family protein [Candidatus Moranbacteria bacterium]
MINEEDKTSEEKIIKILGSDDADCRETEANLYKALEELKMEAYVERVKEPQEIMSYGLMGMPALVVDEKIKISGKVPEVEEIKEALK